MPNEEVEEMTDSLGNVLHVTITQIYWSGSHSVDEDGNLVGSQVAGYLPMLATDAGHLRMHALRETESLMRVGSEPRGFVIPDTPEAAQELYDEARPHRGLIRSIESLLEPREEQL